MFGSNVLRIPTSIRHSTVQNIVLWFLLTAGALKPFMFYLDIPVDLTLLAVVLAVIDIIFTILTRQKWSLNSVQILMLFVLIALQGVMILSLLHTASPDFSLEKTALFSVNILFFIYPMFLRNLNVKLLAKLYLFIFLPAAIWFFLARVIYFSPWDSSHQIIGLRFYEIRRYYMGLGVGVSILIFLLIYLKKPKILTLISVIAIIGLGSRGALIFLLLIVAFWKWKAILLAFGRFKLKSKTALMVYGGCVMFLLFFYDKIFGFIAVGFNRFFVLFDGVSTLGRVERIGFTINSIFESPQSFIFGRGVGSFGILFSGHDVRDYPHNIFLEAWFELGIIGLVLISFFLIAPYFYRRPILLKVIAIFMFLNTLKSGGLAGAWLLFLSYGLLIFNPKLKS